jgi:hypothetical protein
MSSRMLTQDDFSCLGLAAGQDAGSQPLDDYAGFATVEGAENGGSLKSDPVREANEVYHPVNFIPKEVYELIQNWELAYLKKQESIQAFDSMETESSSDFVSSESIFEPTRFMSVSQAPPKRFYRSFWRSVTRRIIQLEKEFALNRAVMSRSNCSSTSRASC